jgi:hypothetical protein
MTVTSNRFFLGHWFGEPAVKSSRKEVVGAGYGRHEYVNLIAKRFS